MGFDIIIAFMGKPCHLLIYIFVMSKFAVMVLEVACQ